MADSTPLLCESDSVDLETSKRESHFPPLNDAIEQHIGEFGRAQLLQAVLVSFAWLFDAQQTFITVFTDARPPWHCTQPSSEQCDSVSSVCQLPKDSWAWDWAEDASTISEWALQCSGPIISSLPASSFFVGCLVGGFVLSSLADSWLGRKKTLFLSCLVMSSAALFSIFSTNVWTYSAFKFISGFGRATVGASALVLSTELVGKRWRGQIGTIGFLCFTLGFLSLPAIAYLNEGSSWRVLYLWTSLPTILYCILVHFFVLESPRWLFVQGRKEEAIATLKSIAPASRHSSLALSFSNLTFQQEARNVDMYSALKILLEKRWAFQRLSAVMAIGFGTGIVYYGIPLAVGNLAFNIYVSVTFNALSELPAALAALFLLGSFNRRSGVLVLTISSGVCSIVCGVMGDVWTGLQMGLELMSFFSACTGLNLFLIYTIELFPTCVRNSAMSMMRQAVVLGGVVSPALVAAGRGNGLMSYGVFGMVIGCCGLFVICLPETRGGTLCDTMDEEEHKHKGAHNVSYDV